MSTTATTLSLAVSASAKFIKVASATGFSVGKVAQVGSELVMVTEVTGTVIGVFRGYAGTRAAAHQAGIAVVVGSAIEFPTNGNGTVGTGVTATELLVGPNHHITTLTFSSLAIGSVTNASKAIGALIYTLPAGIILVKGASMSVGLAGSGTACDADTPDVGLGTTVGSGAQAVLSGVGAAAENILTGQTAGDVASTATTKTLDCTLAVEAADNHTVYQNVADGWAGTADITASGTVIIEWVALS